MHWWHWRRAQHVLETWVRTLIGARPYHVAYKTGGGSYVNLRTREITIDPTMADGWGGNSLLPFVWRGRTVRMLPALQYRISAQGMLFVRSRDSVNESAVHFNGLFVPIVRERNSFALPFLYSGE